MQYQNLVKKILGTFIVLAFCFTPFVSFADTVDDLEGQINAFEEKIKRLESEIAEQRKKVQDTSAKAADLEAAVNSLNATKKALETEIARTENVIGKTETNIKKLSIEITDKQYKIQLTNKALAEAVRSLKTLEDRNFFEMLFSSKTISEFANDLISVEKIKKNLRHTKNDLLELNEELKTKKDEEETEIINLENEQEKLVGQKETVEYTKKEKDSLLAVTKNKEAQYKAILAEKERQKQAFLDTLLEIESKLNLLIDPTSYPEPRKGILSWPVNNVVITQYFGGTQFAKNNPGIYSRPYHPGADFGVSIGTQVKSISDGVIKGVGNTDAYPGCYAWGKFVLVEHDNGLSSLYAHLSSILKTPGTRVSAGDVIALSGNTGVSTGPHLHLGLYATQGVFIDKYYSQKPGGSGCSATEATGVFADLDAYLDPMSYLPSL
jgi:murein DD-endopeptidase MepM/ murein hydrolase activator NlpD